MSNTMQNWRPTRDTCRAVQCHGRITAMNTAPTYARCKHCGSSDVEWRQSKAGKWYLADIRTGARGSTYSDGPHYRSCTAVGPKADENRARAERNARIEARNAAIHARALELIQSGLAAEEIAAIVAAEFPNN